MSEPTFRPDAVPRRTEGKRTDGVVADPPQESSGEQFKASFKIEHGRVVDGETCAFFIESENAELNSATRSLGGNEAPGFFTNSRIKGRSETEMRQAAESLRDRLNNPEVQQRIIELAEKKRQLEQQIEEIEEQYSGLLGE